MPFNIIKRYLAAKAAAKRRSTIVAEIKAAQKNLHLAYANLRNVQMFMAVEPYPGDAARVRELHRECFATAIKITSLSQELERSEIATGPSKRWAASLFGGFKLDQMHDALLPEKAQRKVLPTKSRYSKLTLIEPDGSF